MLRFFSQLNTEDQLIYKEFLEQNDLEWSANYGRLTTPKTMFHNGSTYVTTRDNSATRNPYLIRWNESGIVSVKVGDNLNADTLNHQHAAVLEKDGFIYIVVTDAHGDSVKLYKSITQDIEDGFNLIVSISDKIGYCNVRFLPDGSMRILSRETKGVEPDKYGQVILKSNPNDYHTWAKIQVTRPDFANTNIRHYPCGITHYGDNEWDYLGITLRKDTGLVNLANALYKTKDYDTFYSLDESFSKTISTQGHITIQEIDSNLMYAGISTQPDTYRGVLSAIVIDDTVYATRLNDNIEWEFYKVSPTGVVTTYSADFLNLPTTLSGSPLVFFFYNGSNLVLLSGAKIYACDLNFSNFKVAFDKSIDAPNSLISAFLLPENFDEVQGRYIFGGAYQLIGNFPYIETNDKYFI